MALDGSNPTEVPLPQASEGSYSADGRRLAYVPLLRAFQQWKHYRGGRTTPIWLADLSDSIFVKAIVFSRYQRLGLQPSYGHCRRG
jgi:tricorn protease